MVKWGVFEIFDEILKVVWGVLENFDEILIVLWGILGNFDEIFKCCAEFCETLIK